MEEEKVDCSKPREGDSAYDKACKVCTDFKSYMRIGARSQKPSAEAHQKHRKEDHGKKEEHKKASYHHQAEAEDVECPLDRAELGSKTWGFLHTMAAYYPQQPEPKQKEDMRQFMELFSEFYPCHKCAKHLRKDMKKDPPKTESQEALSQWLCSIHNRVNAHIGKEQFDCSKVNERWRDGWKDGSCG